MTEVYNELNKAWKATCKVLFGEEIGELKEYEEWLKELYPDIEKKKSHISSKDVVVGIPDYCKDAKFISLDEVREIAIEPLNINEIKDIDSIIEAISEKWEYTGNRILGRSTFIESSDVVIDSHYVADSFYVYKSSYVLGSMGIRKAKYIFGSRGVHDETEFVIRSSAGGNVKRSFEAGPNLYDCSDLYFSSYCFSCSDLMFSFNQRNKMYMIGNLQLSKEKYFALKAKLIEEIRDELKKEKKFPSLFQFLSNKEPSEEAKSCVKEKQEEVGDITPIEKAFSSTFKILFKREISGINDYEKWLVKHARLPYEFISPFGQKVYAYSLPEYQKLISLLPKKRMINHIEALQLSNLHLSEEEISSLDKIKENVEKIGYVSLHHYTGKFGNIISCPVVDNVFNVYKCGGVLRGEYIGMSNIVGSNVKYIFGSNRTEDSQFGIHCYYSAGLTRCFEVDSSTNCSDTYFAHNCEGLQDAMFCWNTKGKRYAIGNLQLPPDQYRKIKDMLVEQMADEILSKKELKYDIFNIGCGKK
jgi:predicted metal-binding transcription factor (methanogenesis marker protein 9)